MNCPLCGGFMRDYQAVCPYCEDGKKVVCRECKRIMRRDPFCPEDRLCSHCRSKEPEVKA